MLLRQLFCCLRALKGEPFSISPVLGTAVRVLVPLVLLPRKACLEQSGPGGFEDLLLYLVDGRHEVQGRVAPLRPSRNRLPEEFVVDENQSRASALNALFFHQLIHLVYM